MMYYVNWVLTNAQLELLSADVSVVDYHYGDDKKKKKGEFDNTSADSSSVRKANEEWLEKHKYDGGRMSVDGILGNGLGQGVGVKIK